MSSRTGARVHPFPPTSWLKPTKTFRLADSSDNQVYSNLLSIYLGLFLAPIDAVSVHQQHMLRLSVNFPRKQRLAPPVGPGPPERNLLAWAHRALPGNPSTEAERRLLKRIPPHIQTLPSKSAKSNRSLVYSESITITHQRGYQTAHRWGNRGLLAHMRTLR